MEDVLFPDSDSRAKLFGVILFFNANQPLFSLVAGIKLPREGGLIRKTLEASNKKLDDQPDRASIATNQGQ